MLVLDRNSNKVAITEKAATAGNDIFQDKYKKIKILGKGNFGQVFLAQDKRTQKQVAIKVVDTRRFKNEDQKRHSENEKEICKSLISRQQNYIVNVIDVTQDEFCIYFVLEYVDGGELYERIKLNGKIGEAQAKIWFKQLIEAIAYIHKQGIVHRDLKPENVLLGKDDCIRLCDFGFGKMFNDASKLLDTYCGSPFYAAPEMVTATPYKGPPVDMWSCGVILYAMLTGQLPFHCDTMPELFKKISLAEYFEPNNLSDEALHLIRSLLCKNPKRRLTAENVLRHPWILDNPGIGIIKKKINLNSFMKTHHYYQHHQQSSLSSSVTIDLLPSPIISVDDEELASYQIINKEQTHSSKTTRFLMNALHKQSQVAPSYKCNGSTSSATKLKPNHSKAIYITAIKIKKFFSNTFIHKRLTTV